MKINNLSSAALVISSLTVGNAYALSIDSHSCNSNITSDLRFEDNQLFIKSTKNQDILFEANGEVFVDGTQVSLSYSEKTLAKRYYDDIHASIPMVVDISIEALNITNMALGEVFTGLLGEDSKVPSIINEKLTQAAQSIEQHVYQNPNSLTYNSYQLKNEFGYADNIDTQIEEIKEEVMSSLMGELFISFGKAMLGGDSDFSDFEKRMESLGEEIETKAEELAASLEDKAHNLCERMKSVDDTENKLQSIDELRHLNMIDMKNKA